MKRIGLLGGTFNPIHIGHLAIAQKAVEECKLDKVYFIPCQLPPHKRILSMAPAAARLTMVRLAIRGNRYFDVSDSEIKRPGKSYSVDTIRYFRKRKPPSRLFFIVGGDNASSLHTWKDIEQIAQWVTFIIVNRPGHKIFVPKGIRYIGITMPGIQVSASYIRRCLRHHRSAKYFLRDNVLAYIEKKKLYQSS